VKASVVIAAYNAEATIGQCLEACLEQTLGAIEVIVCDDGSTDDTARIVQEYPVHYVRLDHQGPAAARNRGAEAAQGDMVVFTDSDCVPEPTWLARLMVRFDEDVVGVGGSYGIANSEHWLARLVHEEIMERHRGDRREVDFLGSFNVAYQREEFLALNGFDENFKAASGEDNDLAYRIYDAGGRLMFVPDARVAHYHPHRLTPYLRTQARHGFWRMKIYQKHMSRSGGDSYAGLGDLLAPPLSLAAIAATLWLASTGWLLPHFALASWCAIIAIVTYGLLRAVLPLRMMVRTGKAEMAFFYPVAVLRDVARAIGMLRGMWWFLICRKETT
jgi:glycosyltransferase involved in cell wall biosynthesis